MWPPKTRKEGGICKIISLCISVIIIGSIVLLLRYAAICCIIEPPYLKRWNIRLCKNAKSGLLLMLLQIYPSQFCMEAKDETRRTWLKSVSSGGVDLHLKCKAHKWEFPLAQQSFYSGSRPLRSSIVDL